MDWRHRAVCRDEDPELFFPVGNSGPALAQIADAKLVCNRCAVTTECLGWALNTGQDSRLREVRCDHRRKGQERRDEQVRQLIAVEIIEDTPACLIRPPEVQARPFRVVLESTNFCP